MILRVWTDSSQSVQCSYLCCSWENEPTYVFTSVVFYWSRKWLGIYEIFGCLISSSKICSAHNYLMTTIHWYFVPHLFKIVDCTLFSTFLLHKLWIYLYIVSINLKNWHQWVPPSKERFTGQWHSRLSILPNLVGCVLPLDVNLQVEPVWQPTQVHHGISSTVPENLNLQANPDLDTSCQMPPPAPFAASSWSRLGPSSIKWHWPVV
jgi:hypothetical protein